MNPTPLVSISCITYNHAPYIRECLDGFMMQQTSFPFEVLIHDDASTDGTTEIIREYAEKYPDIIKPLYEEENQWVKGRRGSAVFNFPRAQGKYIALCEGDDYWTDPLKLQKQVDFLESHPDYVMCSHHLNIYNQNNNNLGEDCYLEFTEDFTYDLDYFISREAWITQPLTLLFKRDALDLEKYSQYHNAKDVTLIYHILSHGKGVFLKECMATYRVHNGGIWSGSIRAQQIKADIDTTMGIYDIEKNIFAATLIKNSIYIGGYLGFTFLKQFPKEYLKAIKIIYHELGGKCAIKSMIHSFNYFHSHFGY